MPVIRKLATVVSVDYELSDVSVGESIHFLPDVNNAYDKCAINAFRPGEKEKIGYMTASPHTTLPGCENNRQLIGFMPSATVPLVGTVVEKKEVSFRNGTISTVLKVELYVVEKVQAV